MIILGLYIAIFISMVILAIWLHDVLLRPPTGCHAREDAPTVGDALADWIREHVRGCVHVADDITRWHPWRSLQIRLWVRELRVPAAASAPGEGTVPDVLSTVQGAVPLEVRITASDGYPAVGFRPGKQPWPTADMPRLPEMLP